MEDKDLTQKIDAILQKRARCEQLTDEENIIVNDVVNKLLMGKKSVNKLVTIKTGEEVRKGDAKLPVSAEEPERDFKGAFDSKVKIESTGDTPDPAKMPKQVRDEKLTDQKDEKIPTEDNSGKIKADYKKEEFADLDEKPRDVNYEEDRMANIKEGQHEYKDSIRTGALVTKSYPNGRKMVGAIVKVYPPVKGQQGILVKWSDGRWEPVNVKEVELLDKKMETRPSGLKVFPKGHILRPSEENITSMENLGVGFKRNPDWKPAAKPAKVMESLDIKKPEVMVEKKFEKPVDSKDAKKPNAKDGKKPFPPSAKDDKKPEVVPSKDDKQPEDTTVMKPEHEMQHRHLGEKHGLEMQHLGEKQQLETDQTFPPQDVEQVDQPQDVEQVDQSQEGTQLDSNQLPEEPPQEWLVEVANTLRQLTDLSDEEIDQAARASWAEIVAGHNPQTEESVDSAKPEESVKPTTFQAQKTVVAEDVVKGEAPPSKWMENCKAALERDNADVDNPWAICTASYQKMKNKGVLDGDIVKISVEDMRETCPECADKMVKNNIKFLKVTVGDYNKLS